LRHVGEPPATTVATLPAQPVGTVLPDGLYALVDIGMELG
jgi:hypothetical protein